MDLLESQFDKQMKVENAKNQKTLQTTLKDFVSAINYHFKEVAPLLLKGCCASNETYKKYRILLSLICDQKQAVVPRCALPKMTVPFQLPLYVEERVD